MIDLKKLYKKLVKSLKHFEISFNKFYKRFNRDDLFREMVLMLNDLNFGK